MSIDYKAFYERVKNLHQDLIYQLGTSYIHGRKYECVLISFIQHLEVAIYPNDIFLKDTLPIKEIPYEEIN